MPLRGRHQDLLCSSDDRATACSSAGSAELPSALRGAVALSRREARDFGVLALIDARVERWVASQRMGPADVVAHALSSAADRSKLWVGMGLLRAAHGDRRGRLLAVRAIAVVAAQSALVNLVVKRRFERVRPPVEVTLRFGARRPPSSSFPSGHAASAAAAAVLLGDGDPVWSAFLAALAAGVSWSRVQTGLHHSSDAVAGVALGVSVAVFARRFLPVG